MQSNCPYCQEMAVIPAKLTKCSACRVQLRLRQIENIEERVEVNALNSFFVGTSEERIVKMILPASFIGPSAFAFFPTHGIGVNSPLSFFTEKNNYPQSHPQLESPFTRFFVKGMLFSGLGNLIPFMLFAPPIWMFWVSTFAWATVYYYFTRKITKKYAN
jgi:hypothetical protein